MLDDGARWRGGLVPQLTDDQVAYAEKALARYRTAPSGTSADQFEKLMAKLAAVYPAGRLTEAENDLRLEVYTEQLSDVPWDMLEAARVAATRQLKFFPSIAELREFAYSLPRPVRLQRQARLALLIEAAAARRASAPAPDLVDPADMAALVQRLGIDPSRTERRERVTTAAGATVGREPPRAPTEADMIAIMGEDSWRAAQAAAAGQQDEVRAA